MGGYTPEFYSGGVFKSTDQGQTWKQLTFLDKSDTSHYFRVLAVNSQTIFALGNQFHNNEQAVGLIRSDDAGVTWQVLNPENVYLEDFDVFPSDPNIIYANSAPQGNPEGIYASTDGGETWVNTKQKGAGSLRVSPHSPDVVLFSWRDKLFRSDDGLKNDRTHYDLRT